MNKEIKIIEIIQTLINLAFKIAIIVMLITLSYNKIIDFTELTSYKIEYRSTEVKDEKDIYCISKYSMIDRYGNTKDVAEFSDTENGSIKFSISLNEYFNDYIQVGNKYKATLIYYILQDDKNSTITTTNYYRCKLANRIFEISTYDEIDQTLSTAKAEDTKNKIIIKAFNCIENTFNSRELWQLLITISVYWVTIYLFDLILGILYKRLYKNKHSKHSKPDVYKEYEDVNDCT